MRATLGEIKRERVEGERIESLESEGGSSQPCYEVFVHRPHVPAHSDDTAGEYVEASLRDTASATIAVGHPDLVHERCKSAVAGAKAV